MSTATLSATIIERSPATLIHLDGDLDAATTRDLARVVEGALNAGVRHLVLDLSSLEFVDSTGLDIILRLHCKAEQVGADLIVCNPSPTTSKLIELTHSGTVLNIQHR
jgi:stage II sporulation protein AA (anti-sigma F factor antagonist)